MVPVSRLRTAPHSHFICCPPPPSPSALLYSSQTRLYLGSHFIPPPPSKRPRCSGHQGFTTNSHDPGSTEKQQFAFPSFRIIDCQKNYSPVLQPPLFVWYRRDKSVKDKDKYKDKTVKEGSKLFPRGPNSFAGVTEGSSPYYHLPFSHTKHKD